MKITRAQLKQIIKEELGDWTPEMQQRARHSPMIAAVTGPGEPSRRTATAPAVPDAERILQDMKDVYDRLEGDPGEQKLLEDDLLNGLGALVAAWRQGREEGY